ncbi:hypothetical protein [Streptomyces sp. CA-179760]|uniref:hypothetical protein n=1 Tax=Streptomyces sp. CA-179760 TaxID=3240054 RepID=UPI003D9119DB
MAASELTNSLPLRVLAGGRIFVAATHLLTPRLITRAFGMKATGTPAIAYGRMFGIRTAFLAAGLLNLEKFSEPRTFVKINVLIDTVDAVAFLAAGQRKDVSATSAALGVGVSLTAAAAGAVALRNDLGR